MNCSSTATDMMILNLKRRAGRRYLALSDWVNPQNQVTRSRSIRVGLFLCRTRAVFTPFLEFCFDLKRNFS